MRSLEEAIEYEEFSTARCKHFKEQLGDSLSKNYTELIEYHGQLTEWLKELKTYQDFFKCMKDELLELGYTVEDVAGLHMTLVDGAEISQSVNEFCESIDDLIDPPPHVRLNEEC